MASLPSLSLPLLPGAIGDLVVLHLSTLEVYASLARVSIFWRNRSYREEVARVLAYRDIRDDCDDVYARVGESWRAVIRSAFTSAPMTLHGKVIYTARHNMIGMLRMLTIEYGINSLVTSVDIHTRDSPLHIASERGCGRYITMASSLGYNIEALNARKATPLHTACYFGRVDAVSSLIEAKANIEAQEDRYRQRPLHIASSRGFLPCVQLLVDAGCKIDVADRDLYFPVRLARDYNHHDIAKYLETSLAERKATISSSSPLVAMDVTATGLSLIYRGHGHDQKNGNSNSNDDSKRSDNTNTNNSTNDNGSNNHDHDHDHDMDTTDDNDDNDNDNDNDGDTLQ